MEPTIYKPGVYKSPGIYNGAGGIYNGNGVYKDGSNYSRDIHFVLDIPNLDLSNPHQDGVSIDIFGNVVKQDNKIIVYGSAVSYFSINPRQFDLDFQKFTIKTKYSVTHDYGLCSIGLWSKAAVGIDQYWGFNIVQTPNSVNSDIPFYSDVSDNWKRYKPYTGQFPVEQIEEYTQTNSRLQLSTGHYIEAEYTQIPTNIKELDISWYSSSSSSKITLESLEFDITY